jgi:pyoverdine/dityrosine biosynthesis protein Dit1
MKMSCAENPSPKENKPSQILSILSAYRHRSATIPDGFSEFALDLESQLTETVSRGEKVRFILPAFPFKAPAQGNKRKTLGSLPDKAEELALKTLDGFADSIDEIYEGGATIVIVLDTSVDRGMCIQISPERSQELLMIY